MSRYLTTPALVIRRERLGERHKSLVLLTPGHGLLAAVAYGAWGMRSRLRTASEPFTHCLARLYFNPVKHAYKVMELESREGFEGLRIELDRLAAADLWAEVALRSLAGGDTSMGLYRLFLSCLHALEAGVPPSYATVQYLWRFLELAGCRPDIAACEQCGRPFGDEEGCRWVPSAGALRCLSCAPQGAAPLAAGGRRYLQATQSLAVAQAVAVRLEPLALAGLRHMLEQAIRDVLETDLRSLLGTGQQPMPRSQRPAPEPVPGSSQ